MSDPVPVPRILHELGGADGTAGVVWRLAEPGRQLDANHVALAPDQVVETHAEPDLDVLLVVVSGAGAVETDGRRLALAEGTVLWLPRGSRRRLVAGPAGLGWLTVHRRRPGLAIGTAPGR